MVLMERLVSRSSRSLAVMVGASTTARGPCFDDRRGRPMSRAPHRPPLAAVPRSPQVFSSSPH